MNLNDSKTMYMQFVRYFTHKNKKNIFRQALEIMKCALKYKCLPQAYLYYGLYDKKFSEKQVLNFVPYSVIDRLRPEFNDEENGHNLLLDNKQFFRQIMADINIKSPNVPVYIMNETFFGPDKSVITLEKALEILEATDYKRIFMKAHRGAHARSVWCLERNSDGKSFTHSNGNTIDVSFLKSLTEKGNYLFEEGVVQHPQLSAIYPNAANTFRTITHFTPGKGAKVLFSTLRLGRGGAVVDNLRASDVAGGICVRVDPETGQLDPIAYDYFSNIYKEHPDTGAVFAEQKLEFVPEMMEACVKGANALCTLQSIAWDVTYGLDAPVMIEGNYKWGMYTVQYPNCGIADVIEREWGIRF